MSCFGLLNIPGRQLSLKGLMGPCARRGHSLYPFTIGSPYNLSSSLTRRHDSGNPSESTKKWIRKNTSDTIPYLCSACFEECFLVSVHFLFQHSGWTTKKVSLSRPSVSRDTASFTAELVITTQDGPAECPQASHSRAAHQFAAWGTARSPHSSQVAPGLQGSIHNEMTKSELLQ